MNPLAGKIALVTGASRGLGFAVAKSLAMHGVHVFATARTQGGLEDLDDAVQAGNGTRPTLVPIDLTDTGAVERLAEAIYQRHGHLDILVHCAAHAPHLSPVDHIDMKEMDKAIALNIRAVQTLIRITDPLFAKADAPKAIFMADPKDGMGFWGTYDATKTAGITLAKSYAAERRKSALDVIIHRPPPMPTALRARFFPSELRDGLTPCADAARDVIALL